MEGELFESSEFTDVGVAPDLGSLPGPSKRGRQALRGTPFYNGSTLREISRWQGYSIQSVPGNTDPFVRESLKLHDRERYDSLFGFTRRGEGVRGAYASLFKYDKPKQTFNNLSLDQRKCMRAAIAATRKRFTLPQKLQPLSLKEANKCLKTDTSAGFSFRGRRKGEVLPEIYDAAKWLRHRAKYCKGPRFDPRQVRIPPCLAGTRGHMSPLDDPKTRLFWLYPAEMLNIEGEYAVPLIDSFASWDRNPMLTGKSAQRLYTEWLVRRNEGELLHGLDLSGFDRSPLPWLMHVGFDILFSNIDLQKGRASTHRKQRKRRNVLEMIKWYFINTSILMPDGRLFRKYAGVPSGSWFTQLIDSVCNDILTNYVCFCQGVTPLGLRVLGDDSGFRALTKLSITQAQRDVEPLNFVFHPDKCEITEDPSEFKLLGTRYVGSRQHRDTQEWFKFILYPEQPPEDVGQSMSRFVGLWLCGAMWDPAFCKFFEYYQTCYDIPHSGTFTRDQRKWMSIAQPLRKPPLGWSSSSGLFWKSIFYTFG